MDIFRQQKYLTRAVITLVFLNIGLISFFVWREVKPHHEPLLFPKNEAYKNLTDILKKELQLNEKQVQQFHSIREDYFRQEVELKQKIKDNKDEMNAEMYNKHSNENKIMALAQQTSNFEYQMELLRYQQAKELKSICNPEQQDKFEVLVKEIRDYFRPDNQPNRK
jgi:Spy/CpxP family protein refolding chaperone